MLGALGVSLAESVTQFLVNVDSSGPVASVQGFFYSPASQEHRMSHVLLLSLFPSPAESQTRITVSDPYYNNVIYC